MSGQSSTRDTSRVTICVMRHGMAEHSAPRDSLRELVAFGEQQARESATWFANTYPEFQFDLAIVSPYLRAQQTFDIAKQYLSVVDYELNQDVTPESDASDMQNYLYALCNRQHPTDNLNTVLIVSHMPFVSLLVAELTKDGNAELFNTGAIAVINCDRETLKGTLLHHHQSLM